MSASEKMAVSFVESIGVTRLASDRFVSIHNAERTGNTANIAFGGCVLSLAINVGVEAVPRQFFCYSAQGLYLGPTLTSEKVGFVIHKIRDTKTFKTVRVEALQTQKGTERTTFYITLDFQLKEPPVLKYNLTPRIEPQAPEDLLDYEVHLQQRVDAGSLDQHLIKLFVKRFSVVRKYFDMRHCPHSVSGQNLLGIEKNAKTSQDDLQMTDKSSAYWFRCRTAISHAESYAAIGFMTDAALAFLPLTFRSEFIDDYGALSSLDCSLRYHTSDFDCTDWLLHEQITEAADDGRTFSVGRVFRRDGVLVATMSQMSILRPKSSPRATKI